MCYYYLIFFHKRNGFTQLENQVFNFSDDFKGLLNFLYGIPAIQCASTFSTLSITQRHLVAALAPMLMVFLSVAAHNAVNTEGTKVVCFDSPCWLAPCTVWRYHETYRSWALHLCKKGGKLRWPDIWAGRCSAPEILASSDSQYTKSSAKSGGLSSEIAATQNFVFFRKNGWVVGHRIYFGFTKPKAT